MEGRKVNFDKDTGESLIKNSFIIKRLTPSPNSPFVQVDFSLNQNHIHSTLAQDLQTRNCVPTFNTDSTYYTPAFILGADKQKYITNGSSYLLMHQQKKQELCGQKEDIVYILQQQFVAKPSKSNSYCCICKSLFDDYLTHVNIPIHQQLMHASEFTQSIAQLCELFNPGEVESKPQRNKKRGKKIEKCRKDKRTIRDLNIILVSTSTNIDYSNDRLQGVTA